MKRLIYLLLSLILCLSLTAPAIAYGAIVKLNNSRLDLFTGETYSLKLSGSSGAITWTSSKKSVATVNSKGKVTAIKEGEATITAFVSTKKLICKVTVRADEPVTVTVTNMLYNDELTEFLSTIDIIDSVVNDDYTTTYTMKKSSQKRILKYISELFNKDNIPKLPTYYHSIDINSDLTEFTLSVDKKEYEAAEDVSTLLGLLIISIGYQQFAGINDENIKFSIKLIDKNTNKVFASFNETDFN